MRANYGKALREFLTTKVTLRQIIDFGDLPVFQKATTYPAIFLTQNKPVTKQKFIYTPIKTLDFSSLKEEVIKVGLELDERSIVGNSWTLASQDEIAVLDKMNNVGITLMEYVDGHIYWGLKTGLNKAFIIDAETRSRLVEEDNRLKEIIKPFLFGNDLKRYCVNDRERYLILLPKGWTNAHMEQGVNAWEWLQGEYPSLADHLHPFMNDALKRGDKGDYWWELRACEYYPEFERPKIVFPDISQRGNFALDEVGQYYCANTVYLIGSADKYLLGILNSKLITYFYSRISSTYRGGYLRFFRQDIGRIPIPRINSDSLSDKAKYDNMISLVDNILYQYKQLSEAKTDFEAKLIQRQIDTIDKQIDQLVYKIYGLTDEEIKIVEG